MYKNIYNQICLFLPAPSSAPNSVSASDITSSNITVHWGPADCIHQNGDIIGYSVQYRSLRSRSTETKNVTGVTTETIITGLYPTTTYSLEVAAVNSAGIGVYSATIYAITKGLYLR